MDETLRQWGDNLRLARKALGMTQQQVADGCDVQRPTVCRWEKGQIEPKRQHKARLATVLHSDVRLLFPITRGAA